MSITKAIEEVLNRFELEPAVYAVAKKLIDGNFIALRGEPTQIAVSQILETMVNHGFNLDEDYPEEDVISMMKMLLSVKSAYKNVREVSVVGILNEFSLSSDSTLMHYTLSRQLVREIALES